MLTPSFSTGITADPSSIVITDTSTGTDVAVVGRKVNLYDVSNALFGNSPYDFPNFPGTTTLTINPLTKDKAFQIVITWVDVSGMVLYTAGLIVAFTGYGEQYYYQLTQNQSGKPDLLNDNGYFENKSKLRTLLDSATQAITIGNDVYSAQTSIDLYQIMLNNPQLYF